MSISESYPTQPCYSRCNLYQSHVVAFRRDKTTTIICKGLLHACKLGITALLNAECYNIPATSVSLLLTTTMYLVLTPYKPYSLLFVLCWQWLNITSIKYKDHKKHNIKKMQFRFLLPRKYCTFFAMFEHSSSLSSSANQRFLPSFKIFNEQHGHDLR